ncbi:MAG: sulfotransferase [Deltaproteobacteria bacterium]|nr:sulfotransferase [Deltaproteobacteria bacterium]
MKLPWSVRAKDGGPLELTVRELPEWVRRTVNAERATREPTPERPLTLSRFLRSLVPNVDRAIFIVGAPRSGTTFVGRCIAALPEVSYHYEPVVTKAAARHIYEGDWDIRRAGWFYREVFRCLQRVHLEGDLVFAEKTPQDSFVIPFLAKAFPRSRFIHVLRDGRDVAASLLRKPWLRADAGGQAGRREPGGYEYGAVARFWVEPDRKLEFETTSDARRCAWSWRRHVEASLSAERRVPPPRWLELRYEAIVDQPAREADRLLDFLHIDHLVSRECLRKVMLARDTSRKRSFESELSEIELADVIFEAEELLRSLGYLADPAPR